MKTSETTIAALFAGAPIYGVVKLPKFQKSGEALKDAKPFLEYLNIPVITHCENSYTVNLPENEWEMATKIPGHDKIVKYTHKETKKVIAVCENQDPASTKPNHFIIDLRPTEDVREIKRGMPNTRFTKDIN